jgi:hypothetical protein
MDRIKPPPVKSGLFPKAIPLLILTIPDAAQ